MSSSTSPSALAPSIYLPPAYCNLSICPIDEAAINYIPNLLANILYLVIFAILLFLQLGLGIKGRTWGFLTGMGAECLLEVLGYGGRIMLWQNVFTFNAFLLYLICLTIAPAFLTASIYLCLARLIIVFTEGRGKMISRFQPRTYTITFIIFDFVSLVLQAVGGALTSTADSKSASDLGVHIMVAGLAWQVVSLIIFMALCVEFALKVRRLPSRRDIAAGGLSELRNSRKLKGFLVALSVATVTIFIRCVYRVAELQGGFNGPIANDQVVFMIFEGPMIMIAVAALTVFHPCLSFEGKWGLAGWSLRNKSAMIMQTSEVNSRPKEAKTKSGAVIAEG